ncbi:MAG: hypothetical protein ACE5G2_02660 [Candidatus Krumholzibacteriia bacterium]
MKLRVIAALVAVLALSAGSASGQSIGVFADPLSGSCNLAWSVGLPGTVFINAILGGSVPGIRGAEFRIDGAPMSGSEALYINTPNPLATIALGDPWSLPGASLSFGACQTGGSVNLYTVTVILLNPLAATDATIGVVPRNPPTNPQIDCSLLNLCDDPAFTAVCVGGGEAFINSGRDCNVAVEEATWSGVKSMYAN